MKKVKWDSSIFEMLSNDGADKKVEEALRIIEKKYPQDPVVAEYLARRLSSSGTYLKYKADIIADVASTGGPGSLSTLLSPLFLRTAGAIVPKLGVPGRPAGGIDCLAQIAGYRTTLTRKEVVSILDGCGYAHFLARGEFAPLDGRLYKIRQRLKIRNVPVLVVASLLAKKIAVGINYVGLDLRVASHGNFGENMEEAAKNALLFKKVAKKFGIHATVGLTDARYPYQPFIGRCEALVALSQVFKNKMSPWLYEHLEDCHTLSISSLPENKRVKIAKINVRDLEKCFLENLRCQGANISSFHSLVKTTEKKHEYELKAEKDGFCTYPISKIRDVILQQQNELSSATSAFPDPVGIVFMRRPGVWVKKGTLIATARIEVRDVKKVFSELCLTICRMSRDSFGPRIEVKNG